MRCVSRDKPKTHTKQKAAAQEPLRADSPEGRALADKLIGHVAPAMPTPELPWEVAQRSPVHRLPIVCNGEASAKRNKDGTIKDGTGNKCKHYWAFRRIPELASSEHVKKGETTRYCRLWQSAEGPMEFGEGREHMANQCDCYEPSKPARPYDAELEQAPPSGPLSKVPETPPPPPFEPGPVPPSAYLATHVYTTPAEKVKIAKDVENARWILYAGHFDNPVRDVVHPIIYIYFRLAYMVDNGDGRIGGSGGLDEIAVDQRYPRTDVRRYDKTRLFALELCLEREPFSPEEYEPPEGGVPWTPVLNKNRVVTAADVLGDDGERTEP